MVELVEEVAFVTLSERSRLCGLRELAWWFWALSELHVVEVACTLYLVLGEGHEFKVEF
ncbi:hypothetical protein QR685DRAFT_571547 [Neurospora intermedia]|uniref:Uncharacterized protein n=1 Tax=Neurospora intermedia TaxID=5142 RepID=A0ABR3DCM7_NEUIN